MEEENGLHTHCCFDGWNYIDVYRVDLVGLKAQKDLLNTVVTITC